MIAPNTPEPEIVADNHHDRADIVMIRRAIKEGWPVTPEMKAKVADKLAKLLDHEAPKVVLGAAKTLVLADGVNVRRESLDQRDDHHAEGRTVHHDHTLTIEDRQSRLAELAANLGVGGLVGGAPQAPGGGRAQPALEPPQPKRTQGGGKN